MDNKRQSKSLSASLSEGLGILNTSAITDKKSGDTSKVVKEMSDPDFALLVIISISRVSE
jgi:hypothetical protein